MACPTCGEVAPAGASWCEACGADLAAVPGVACVSCGEREISDDGYCGSCGHKQPEERDHIEMADGPTVAVTDRGLRHRHNEDAAAIAALGDGTAVLVVCDGVSSTPGSAEASLAAATAARDLLVDRLGSAHQNGTEPASSAETAPDSKSAPEVVIDAALVAATEAAQRKASDAPVVVSNAPHSQGGPPSSTFVAAVGRPAADGGVAISVAWLGDSRAYWVDGDGATMLTSDHELQGSLTRWLGADAIDTEPGIAHHHATGSGRLLLCSDGLWRYAEPETELAALVGRLEGDNTSDAALAAALVNHAVASGGHDNITVALWANQPVEVPDLPLIPSTVGRESDTADE